MHIAIAGNIGSGKTTLAKLLAKHFGWSVQLEDAGSNPYLDDFYNDMSSWSFKLQMFFLGERFKKIVEMKKHKGTFVQDRTIYEDVFIFAPNLLAMGLMSRRDFDTYKSLFELIEGLVTPPDLLIYLRSSTENLVKQIHNRGRSYEKSISTNYLSRLNERYEAWIYEYSRNHLIFDIDDLDFVNNTEDFSTVVSRVDAHLKNFHH